MLKKWRESVVGEVAKRHIAGEGLADAMRVGRWADKGGCRVILSPWAGDGEGFSSMMSSFRKATESIAEAGFEKAMLSIKLNAIRFDRGAFADLWDEAWERGIRLHVDSLGPELGEPTFRLLEWAAARAGGRKLESSAAARRQNGSGDGGFAPRSTADGHRTPDGRSDGNGSHTHWNGDGAPSLGVTLPSRWRRSVDDAGRAADLGLGVRIVKGQWSDPRPGVDASLQYERLAEQLADREVRTGLATHDAGLVERILQRLGRPAADADFGQPDGTMPEPAIELEQFFSLPHNTRALAQRAGIPYRLYIAYGSPALPYNIRFSLTRPEMALWMASDYLLRTKRAWDPT